MGKLFRTMIKAILQPERVVVKAFGSNSPKEQPEANTTDKFFVDKNGAISLNPNSVIVKEAIENNINLLKNVHGKANKCGQQ